MSVRVLFGVSSALHRPSLRKLAYHRGQRFFRHVCNQSCAVRQGPTAVSAVCFASPVHA